MQLGIITRKNWPLSVDQCQLQALQILVHLIDMLSILLRCNSFTRIQKAVVDQTGSTPLYSDCDPFFWCKFGIGKCFGASPQSNHWAGCCQLSYKIYFSSHVTIQSRNGSLLLHRIREDNTSKWFFWFVASSGGTYLPSFFTFPICFKCQMITEWSTLSS